MWEWSRTVTERAVAATWQSRRCSKPTVVDVEYWVGDQLDEDAMISAGSGAYCLAG
jgi:hypothetical protein